MTVGIYGRGLANRAGIGRYTRELLRALLASQSLHRFRIFAGEVTALENAQWLKDSTVVLRGSGNRLTEEHIALPVQLMREKPDVFHNPDFTLPLCPTWKCSNVVTVHDLAYLRLPESNSFKSKALLKAFVPKSIRCSEAVIAVSEFTKREIIEVYGVEPDKIHVIPNGIEARLTPAPRERIDEIRMRFDLPDSGMVLYLGGIEPRKNIVRLAEAVARIDGATLAIAGGRNRNGTEILARVESILGPRVRMLGFVKDTDLPALYGAAQVFAYPSVYEGFGIPPVEAMACGTPVVAGNVASLPEACGDAAELVDPYSVDAIAGAIEKLLGNPVLRSQRSESGIAQAQRFRWDAVAKQTIGLYESLGRC